MKREINTLFLYCERHDKLEKAVRRVFGCPQWFMAQRLLTSQCYISQWERGKLKKQGEEERLWYNLQLELEEKFGEMDTIERYLTMINVLNTYFRMTKRFRLGDRDDIRAQITKLSRQMSDILEKNGG